MAYRLPAYAVPRLSPLGLAALTNIGAMDVYDGLVAGSFFRISPATLFYESKLAVDGDGLGGQQPGDTDYQSDTSLHDGAGQALNALVYPFMVLPQRPLPPGATAPRLEDFGVRLGDIGAAFWNTAWTPFVYGDVGPHGQIGEGSIFVAKELGMNSSPAFGGISSGEIPPGVCHVVFPGTTDVVNGRTQRNVADIRTEALRQLSAIGIVPNPPAAQANLSAGR
jgi:hypothetical protein